MLTEAKKTQTVKFLHKYGMSIVSIAKNLGLTKEYVRNAIKKRSYGKKRTK
jgi:predicted transcriptional regulator